MTAQTLSVILATGLGVVVVLVVFGTLAFVARRRGGRPGVARAVVLGVLALYGFALWISAVIPFPDPGTIDCVAPQLSPLDPFTGATGALGPGDPLAEPGVLALMVGVTLFLPLGFFVRVLWNRGIGVTIAAAAVVALLLEITQWTGVWGIYPCAFRSFGVDGVVAAAIGGAFGAVGSLALSRTWRLTRAAVAISGPQPVTRWRRGLAMACDWVSVYFIGLVAATPVAAALDLAGGHAAVEASSSALDIVSTYTALAVTGAVALFSGRTIGDRILQLEYRGSGMPPLAARAVRFFAGIGGYQVLTAFTEGANPVSAAFVVLAIVLFFTTAKGRGLPGLASRQTLADVREPAA